MTIRSDLALLCVRPEGSVRDTMACIDRNKSGLALVVNDDGRLVDTISDGDLRRAVLAGVDLDAPVSALRSRRANSPYPAPVTAPAGTEPAALLRLMQERQLRHVPLLDEEQRVVSLVTLRDLLPSQGHPLQAVVMAGGFGNRLRPLTEELPKVMLPIGERPLLELILEQLRQVGIQQVNLATHYKPEVIAKHFGDGSKFGLAIRYVQEDQPLGTAGALSLIEASEQPLLVINGDIVTRVDFRAMLEFHRDHRADMTVGVYPYEVQIPYGVVETDGARIIGLTEKPVLRHFINAGIFLLNPGVRRFVPRGRSYDMTDLISRLIAEGRYVASFPIREYWMDIGHPENYQKAVADHREARVPA